MRARAEAVARELGAGRLTSEPGQCTLMETRRAVLNGWRGLADFLERDGNQQLAAVVRRFAETMPPPLTEKEMIARQLRARLQTHSPNERTPTL